MMCLSSLFDPSSGHFAVQPLGFSSNLPTELRQEEIRPTVIWAMTRACNLRRCHYCDSFIRQSDLMQELSYHQGLTLLDDLAGMGVHRLVMTGGEPLCRPDMPELLGYAVSLGLFCQVQTNGLLLNDAMADRLAGLGLRDIYVAIDGMRQTHDRLRNQVGAFVRTTAGIDRCVARGIDVTVRFAIHQLNELELESVFDYCLTHCVRRLVVQHTASDWSEGSSERLSLSQTRQWVTRLLNLTARSVQAGRTLEVCTLGNHADAAMAQLYIQQHAPAQMLKAGRWLQTLREYEQKKVTACIDAVGQVGFMRDGTRHRMGDLEQASFSQIWLDPANRQQRDQYVLQVLAPRTCRTCRHVASCGGNVRQLNVTGSLAMPVNDPWCYLEPDEIATMALPESDSMASA